MTTVVSIVLVVVLARVAGGPDIASKLRNVGVRGPLIVAGAWIPLLLVQTLRWRASIVKVAPRPFFELVLLRGLGNALNAFLPARAGDLARLELLSRRSGVDRRTVAGAELVDMMIDKLGWLPAMLIVTAFGHPAPWLIRIVPWIVGLGAAGLVGLALLVRWKSAPKWLVPLQLGVAAHGAGAIARRALLLGPLPWLVETAGIVFAAWAAGIPLGVTDAFAALTAMNVAFAVPVPANAGAIEVGLAGTMTALGTEPGTAMAFAVAYHLGQVVPMVLVGVGATLWLRLMAVPFTSMEPDAHNELRDSSGPI